MHRWPFLQFQKGETMNQNNLKDILATLAAIDRGDFSITLNDEGDSIEAQIAQEVNSLAQRLSLVSFEISRISKEIGIDGQFGGQAEIDDLEGEWKELIYDFNKMAEVLTVQVRGLALASREAAEGGSSVAVNAFGRGETHALIEDLNILLTSTRTASA